MDVNDWYRPRSYLHFDIPIGRTKAVSIATSPSKVAKHSFYPFLHYNVSSSKIFKDEFNDICVKPKVRPIAFASHVDAHIYSYYSSLLSGFYEKAILGQGLDANVLAFRKLGKSNIDFAFEAFEAIRNLGACSAFAYDISGFFDNLDHRLLRDAWASLLNVEQLPKDHYAVYKSLTRYAQVSRVAVYERLGLPKQKRPKGRRRICEPEEFRTIVRGEGLVERNSQKSKEGKPIGIPQGSPISALLSNIYMFEFDKVIKEAIEEQGGIYFRYCDDMLIIVPPQWKNSVSDFLRSEIKKLHIDINTDKTEIRDFYLHNGQLTANKPLQYLGFLFDGSSIYLRSASLSRYSERMKRGVKLAKMTRRKRNRIRASKGQPQTQLYKRKLYANYSHLGNRNFIRYGLRAAEKMESRAIKRQLKPLWSRLQKQITKKPN